MLTLKSANYLRMIISIFIFTFSQELFSNALEFSLVNSWIQDSDGKFWCGTEDGLYCYNENKWMHYNSENNGLPHSYIKSIILRKEGGIWCITGNGIGRFDGQKWEPLELPKSELNYQIGSILEDRKGRIWIGTSNGLLLHKKGGWTEYNSCNNLLGNQVVSIAEDHLGNIWIGTNYGITQWDGTNWTSFTSCDGLFSNNILSVFVADDGLVWALSNGGLNRFDGLRWHHFDLSEIHSEIENMVSKTDLNKNETSIGIDQLIKGCIIRTGFELYQGQCRLSLLSIERALPEQLTLKSFEQEMYSKIGKFSKSAGKWMSMDQGIIGSNKSEEIVYYKSLLDHNLISISTRFGCMFYIQSELKIDQVPIVKEGFCALTFKNTDGRPKPVRYLNILD